jgi:SAM-dependent methyltransferase
MASGPGSDLRNTGYSNINSRATCVCGSQRRGVDNNIFEVTDKQNDPILPRYYFKCPDCHSYSAPNIYFPIDKYDSVPMEHITITDVKRDLNDRRVNRIALQDHLATMDAPVLYDLGSGEGCFTHAFIGRYPRGQAYACEADARMKQKFYGSSDRVFFVNEFIEHFLDKQIEDRHLPPADVVVLTDVLEHVIEPEDLLAKIRRVMVPGGVAYLVVPNAATLGEGRRIENSDVDWSHANRTCQHIWMFDHATFLTLVESQLEVLESDERFETDQRRDSIYTTVVAQRT